MSPKETREIREFLWLKNKKQCPVLDIALESTDCNLDHAHQNSLETETIEGQIRSTIHRFANQLEGQMRSKFIRSGAAKYITFEKFLFNLYMYLMEYREPLLHPSNKPKNAKLMKSSFNELIREMNRCNEYLAKPIKIPTYPKSKRYTKKIKELFESYGIKPKFYGSR